jgi:hypothetical protein
MSFLLKFLQRGSELADTVGRDSIAELHYWPGFVKQGLERLYF